MIASGNRNCKRTLLPLLLFCTGFVCTAQVHVQAPVALHGFTRLTSYDTLQAYLHSLDGLPGIKVARIARTAQGRDVCCVFLSRTARFGEDTTKLRVMLFAQQHGDEPSGKEALTLLLASAANHDLDKILSRIDLLVIPQMNPDGAELRQRRTPGGLDLNRDHLLLSSPETRGLHDLFAAWWPEVTMDIHEYGPFSRAWSDSGIVKAADVQLGMLTNLNSAESLRKFEREVVFPRILSAMSDSNYLFHEYLVGSPQDYIRFSTTEPNDGRQSFGILNTLSFIQEGRGGQTLEDRLERRSRSQRASIEALLSFCSLHADEIQALVRGARESLCRAAGRQAILCMDHFPGGTSLRIPVVRVPSGRDSIWLVHPLRDRVSALCSREVPSAYVIPRELDAIREILERHHVLGEVVKAPRRENVSVYLIEGVQPDTLEDEWHPKPALRGVTRTQELRPGDFVVRTNQRHSLFLSIFLEPESMWGIVKYPAFSFLMQSKEYPIMRIP